MILNDEITIFKKIKIKYFFNFFFLKVFFQLKTECILEVHFSTQLDVFHHVWNESIIEESPKYLILFGGFFPCQWRLYLLRYSILFSGGTTVPGSLASTPLGGSRENINKLKIEVNPSTKILVGSTLPLLFTIIEVFKYCVFLSSNKTFCMINFLKNFYFIVL